MKEKELTPAKNPIVVGMINAVEKTRIPQSSMGPTWDGRIKPDIMAPGGSSQFRVDETSPFEVEIDYIKLYRQGESTPYIVNDFETNRLNLDLSWTYPPTNPCKEENHRLHCLVNHHPISIYNDYTASNRTVYCMETDRQNRHRYDGRSGSPLQNRQGQ